MRYLIKLVVSDEEKSFITLASGVNVIRLFLCQCHSGINALAYFSESVKEEFFI